MLTFLLLLSLWSKGTNTSVLNSHIRPFQVPFSTLALFLCKKSLIFLKNYLFENMTRLTAKVQHRHWKSAMWATWHFGALAFKRDLHQPWKILYGVVWLVIFINISLWIFKGQLKPVLFSCWQKDVKRPGPEDGFVLYIDILLPLQTPSMDIS